MLDLEQRQILRELANEIASRNWYARRQVQPIEPGCVGGRICDEGEISGVSSGVGDDLPVVWRKQVDGFKREVGSVAGPEEHNVVVWCTLDVQLRSWYRLIRTDVTAIAAGRICDGD